MNKDFKKRTWHYVQKPATYEITCDRCGGSNIEWSEFEGMIWCPKCLIDTPGTKGIFDGPIPVKVCEILGLSLDRWDMVNKRIIKLEEYLK